MFKKLDEWMEQYEKEIYDKLIETQQLMREWKEEKRAQKTLDVNYRTYYMDKEPVMIPEMKNYCCAIISPNWERVMEKAIVKHYTENEGIKLTTEEVPVIIDKIQIRGQFYKDYVAGGDYSVSKKYNGLETLLKVHGCSLSDADWISIGRSEEDIRIKAHKDMLNQKKMIEAKVRKICGDEITNVDDESGDIYAKGSNGRTAHIYAIWAGGYNIQRLHIRILVKEVK